jgi:uncharacterized protein YoxC
MQPADAGRDGNDLAVQVAAIARDVAAVTKSVESVAHLVESLTDRIEVVSHRSETTASRVGRPDWQAWAFCGTIILGLVGLFGSGYVRDLTRLEGGQQALTIAQTQAALSGEYHRGRGTAKDEELQSGIEKLDAMMQRELSLTIDRADAGLVGLDHRISVELNSDTDRMCTRIDALTDDVRTSAVELARLGAILDLVTNGGLRNGP